jgi:S1-C subfamily serine protease
VRVTNPRTGAHASGLLLRGDDRFAYILTAGHIATTASIVQVEVFGAASYPRPAATYEDGVVVAQSRREDLAVVRLKRGAALPKPLPLCPPGEVPSAHDFTALFSGCAFGKSPTAETVTIKGKKRIQRPGESSPVWAWESTTDSAKGKSGGPLLDQKGHVLGVASGNSSGHTYFTHVQEIRHFLENNKLGFLGRDK